MAVRIKKGSSFLVHANLLSVDGVEFWQRPEIPELPASSRDTPHTVEDGDTLERIAKKHFNRDDWDWVIAHKNNLRLLPSELRPGMVLMIPDTATVREKLF